MLSNIILLNRDSHDAIVTAWLTTVT
jgi:hypothetical protein